MEWQLFAHLLKYNCLKNNKYFPFVPNSFLLTVRNDSLRNDFWQLPAAWRIFITDFYWVKEQPCYPFWGHYYKLGGNCTCYIIHLIGSRQIPGRPKLTCSETDASSQAGKRNINIAFAIGEHVDELNQIHYWHHSLMPRAWPTDKEPVALFISIFKACFNRIIQNWIFLSHKILSSNVLFHKWEKGSKFEVFTQDHTTG